MAFAAKPYYARLQMDGFPGEKDVVLIPDDYVMDSKSMGFIMKGLNMTPPNLLIEGVGSSVHPVNLLNDKEIALLVDKGIVDKQGERVSKSERVREVMEEKLNAITKAILQSLQETGSSFIAFSTWMITFDIISARALHDFDGTVQGISTFHANDETISDERTKRIIRELLKGSVTLHEDTKESEHQVPVVHVDATWLFDGMNKPWEDHSCLKADRTALLPPEERKPTSQWCNPMAQTFFIFFSRNSSVDKAWDESYKKGMGFDPLTQRDLVAPPGMIFLGGASQSVKDSYSQCFEHAVPALIIKYTGGITNIYAELVESLRKILSGDITELSKVVEQEEQHQVQDAATLLTMSKRVDIVCPQRLLTKAYKNSAQDRNAAVKVTIADVVKMLDVAKARPQVFLHTIKVFDPLAQSEDQALDVLSECVSSTYVGLVSLGASSDEILNEALMMKKAFAMRSSKLQMFNSAFVGLAAILTWCAVFFASLAVSLDSCKEQVLDPNASVGFFCNYFLSHTPNISTLVVLLPITTGFVTTLMSHFRYRQKWAASRMAAKEIESHIFQFRASTGPYTKSSARQNQEAEDEPSSLNVDGLVRHRFSDNLQKIYFQALTTALSNDFVELHPEAAAPEPQNPWRVWALEQLFHFLVRVMKPWRCCTPNNELGSISKVDSEFKDDDFRLMPKPLLKKLQQARRQDNGVSPLTSDEYYNLRFQHLKAKYESAAPGLHKAQRIMNVMIFAGSLVASLLGRCKMSQWIPVVIGFTTMLQNLMLGRNPGAELASVNRALNALESMSKKWEKTHRMDRRAPRFKEQMVTLTEHSHMGVVKTRTGIRTGIGSAAPTVPSEDSQETEQDDQKGRISMKKKASDSQQEQGSTGSRLHTQIEVLGSMRPSKPALSP